MRQMALLNTIKTFLRKNPAYEPDLVELSAAIYLLSCKMIGVRPTKNLATASYRKVKQTRTA